MNTDNYDYEKSSLPQSLDEYTPFLDKQTNNYINDQNSGVYSSNQSLVQFDLSSLYSSSKYTNTNDMFITIPITMVFALSVAGAAPTVAPPTAGWALQTLKSGYHNLIHQADLQIDGKTVSESQPFLGTFTGIKLMSELSQTDLKSFGSVIGFSDVVDTPNSVIYNSDNTTAANWTNGNGLTNNTVFGHSSQPLGNVNQNVGVCNEAINKRALRTLDTSKAGLNKIVGTIVSVDQLKSDFKSTYQVLDNKYGVIYDLAIIRLKDILDVTDKLGLVKRFNGVLRLYINTGALYISCNSGHAADSAVPRYNFSVSNSTFNNTCPFTINNLSIATSAGGGLPFAQTQISAGLFIGKALQTSLNGVNLAAMSPTHPMQACRLYYSTVQLEPEKALSYSRSNQMKNIVYKNYYFNQINAVGIGGNYSQLIQSGITNPYALIIVPYISSTAPGMSGYQWQSPFDTAPATSSPCILSNLQIQLGGQQVLNSSYYYGFEDFVTQYVNCESLSSSDFGVGVGVINKEWWDLNRIYYVNLSRSTKSDRMTPRNIVLSFKNDSLVPIDVKVFTVYLDSFKINVDSGQITTGQM
jgi:hypothetical protein